MAKRLTKSIIRDAPIEDIAEEFGVTISSVRAWVKEKCPHEKYGGRLKFNAGEVAAWRRARGMDTHNRNAGTSPDIDAARLRKENALADKYELQVARERGELISFEEAKRTYGNFIRVMRSRLQAVGVKIASRRPGKEAGRLQAEIDKEVGEALIEVSQTNESDGEALAMAG